MKRDIINCKRCFPLRLLRTSTWKTIVVFVRLWVGEINDWNNQSTGYSNLTWWRWQVELSQAITNSLLKNNLWGISGSFLSLFYPVEWKESARPRESCWKLRSDFPRQWIFTKTKSTDKLETREKKQLVIRFLCFLSLFVTPDVSNVSFTRIAIIYISWQLMENLSFLYWPTHSSNSLIY